jgi:hypothetical protein
MSLFEELSDAVSEQLVTGYLSGAHTGSEGAELGSQLFENTVDYRRLVRFFQNLSDKILTDVGISSQSRAAHGPILDSAIRLAIVALRNKANFRPLSKSNTKAQWLFNQFMPIARTKSADTRADRGPLTPGRN